MGKSRAAYLSLAFLLTATSAIMIGPYPTRSTFPSGTQDAGVGYEAEPFADATTSANLKNQSSGPFQVNVDPEPLHATISSDLHVDPEPLHAAISSDLNLEPEPLHTTVSSDRPALPLRVNTDPLFIHSAVSSGLEPERRFIHVETELLRGTVSSNPKTQEFNSDHGRFIGEPKHPTLTSGINSGDARELKGNKQEMLKVSKGSCINCCVSDTPTSKISLIVGWAMLVYIAVAVLCVAAMMAMSFTKAPRYRIVKDGDRERVKLKWDDVESATLFCGALPCVRDSGRAATMLDVHAEFVKDYLRELSAKDSYRKFIHAVDQAKIVLKALGFPIIFGYIVVRVAWPALVVIGVAHPWPADLEAINRVRP